MGKQLSLLVMVAIVASARIAMPEAQPVIAVAACLHNRGERDADRIRREQAIALAKAINEAQAVASQRTGRYVPLPQLGKLPATPRGFEVRLYTDDGGYVVSIKDTLDPCRYGVFTDQGGFVYDKTPLDAPLVAEDRWWCRWRA